LVFRIAGMQRNLSSNNLGHLGGGLTAASGGGFVALERHRLPSGKHPRARHVAIGRWLCVIIAAAVLVATIGQSGSRASAAPSAAFPPGIWKGAAVITGGLSSADVSAFVTVPIVFDFEVEVAPDGAVTDGQWTVTGEAAAAVTGGEGTMAFTGSGDLAGSGARVTFAGPVHLGGSVSVEGASYPVEVDVDVAGGFSPTSATCNGVSGDFATEARQAQVDVGFASTMVGPFTAVRVGSAGDNLAPGFEDQYVALLTTADQLLQQDPLPAAGVAALAEQVTTFYENVFASASCPGGSPNLEPGTQPYAHFSTKIGALLLNALATPGAYSLDELAELATAAETIGLVGGAAPDANVSQALLDALTMQLDAAEQAENTADCTIIAVLAETLGFAELMAGASACAAGG
jgi:hypothetical protein